MRLPNKKAFRKEADAIMASESYPDFKSEVVKKRLEKAHHDLRRDYFGVAWPHVLGGKEYRSSSTYADTSPYSLKNELGYYQRFDRNWDIDSAIREIDKAQEIWRETPWKVRAEYLYALAHALM